MFLWWIIILLTKNIHANTLPLSICGHIVLQAGAGEAIAISFARVIGLRANIAVTLQS